MNVKPNFTSMATGAEGLFVQDLIGYLRLTWELHPSVMVHELFKFTVREMYRLFSAMRASQRSSPRQQQWLHRRCLCLWLTVHSHDRNTANFILWCTIEGLR